MAKVKISEYDVSASNNTDIDGININEGCTPSGINNAIREVMAHLKDFQSGAVTGNALSVASGGTGAENATDARTNLEAAKSGANSDITAISGLTTPLSAAQGGTGVTSMSALVTSLGLDTTSDAQFDSLGIGTTASGTTGEIRATNNITAFYSSDKKFKENIKDIEDAIHKVDVIGGKTFDWTAEYVDNHGGEDGYFVTKHDIGVIAQDVEEVAPEAVRARTDGSLAVDYPKLVALAFAAIKELNTKVTHLEKQLDAHKTVDHCKQCGDK